MTHHLLLNLQEVFSAAVYADCRVEFYREGAATKVGEKRKHPTAATDSPDSENEAEPIDELLCEPLPAHKLILWSASQRFRAQLERWKQDPSSAGSSGNTSAAGFAFRVPLASEAEVPAARAALKFAYTGRVEADSIREAFEVRRQAAYLQIEGYAAAYDKWIEQWLFPEPGGPSSSGTQPGGGDTGAAPGQTARVLEFFSCSALWPGAEDRSGLDPVIQRTGPLLVAHFRDALATLNSPSLHQQLLDLPAEGLALLLESDDFGTDNESSVLLVLAKWMKQNYTSTDAATRQRLCRLVRLVQLSRPFLHVVLPALASDHETKPEEQVGWFPLTGAEAGFVALYASASEAERKRLREGRAPWDLQQPTYNLKPRAHSVPPEGLAYQWAVDQLELERALGQLVADTLNCVWPTFQGTTLPTRLHAQGLAWGLFLTLTGGKATAGIFIRCHLPPALGLASSRLAAIFEVTGALASLPSRVTVDRTGAARPLHKDFGTLLIEVGSNAPGTGFAIFLPLRCEAGAGDQHTDNSKQDGSGKKDGSGGGLAAMADYLHDGKVTGLLTLLRS